MAHHRWLVEVLADRIDFVLKSHAIHGRQGFHLPAGYCEGLELQERVQLLWWHDSIKAREHVFIGLRITTNTWRGSSPNSYASGRPYPAAAGPGGADGPDARFRRA